MAYKSGPTRLGFAALLKLFEVEGRFRATPARCPSRPGVPAGQLKVPAEVFADYEWTGHTIEYHRPRSAKPWAFAKPRAAAV